MSNPSPRALGRLSPSTGRRGRTGALLASVITAVLTASSCADLPDTHSGHWEEKREFQPAERPPEGGRPPDAPEPPPRTPVPPPEGCKDFDEAVIATCLNQVSAVVPLRDGTALAAERGGRIIRVARDQDPVPVATVSVDAAAGGLSALTPSPSHHQDGLLYAYITTAQDSQVVRIAPGEAAKPILTGIPRLPAGDNRGGLATEPASGTLLVATSGTPVSAADPASLSGKILRIDTSGTAAVDNPGGGRAISSGVVSPGGLCVAPETGAVWVTDSTPDRDLLYRVESGRPLTNPVWSWPDKPRLGGCAAWPDQVSAAARGARALIHLALNPDGTANTPPTMAEQRTWGSLSAMARSTEAEGLVGTVNRAAGEGPPVSSDDRVIRFSRGGGGGGGKD